MAVLSFFCIFAKWKCSDCGAKSDGIMSEKEQDSKYFECRQEMPVNRGCILPLPITHCDSVSYNNIICSEPLGALHHTTLARVGRALLFVVLCLVMGSCAKDEGHGSNGEHFDTHAQWRPGDSNHFWDKNR